LSKRLGWYMDDENKVVNDTAKSIGALISDDLQVKPETVKYYSLGDEFKKTKKNRTIYPYLIILVFLATLFLSIYLMTDSAEEGAKQVKIDISEFKALNLSDMLNAEKRAISQLKIQEDKVISLRNSLRDALKSVSDKMATDLKISLNQASSDDEIKVLKQKHAIALRHQRARYRQFYGAKINKVNIEIEKLKKEVAYHKSKRKGIKAVVDNYTKLIDIKTKSIKHDYEARIRKLTRQKNRELYRLKASQTRYIASLILMYNPKFKKAELIKILNDNFSTKSRELKIPFYHTIFRNEKIISKAKFDGIYAKLVKAISVLNRLQAVRYQNSVPTALYAIEDMLKSVLNDYNSLRVDMVKVIQKKNSYLKNFSFALDSYAKAVHEHGFVVNADNLSNILLLANNSYDVKNGLDAFIIKQNGERAADVRLFFKDGWLRAKMLTSYSNRKIEPFDKLLLKLK